MKLTHTTAAAALALVTAMAMSPFQAAIAEPPQAEHAVKVENFTLTDQAGKSHELYSLVDAPAIVIVPQVNGDPLSRDAIKALEGIKGIFGGAEYFVLNSSPVDTRATIAEEAKELNTSIPMLDDHQQAVAMNLGVTQTGEAFIINPIGWKVVYRGPVTAAAAADQSEQYLLFNALVHVIGHRVIEDADVPVKGSPIHLAAGH